MADITCCIMNNLVGLDFINVHRLYDLKGSTFGRRTKLSDKEKESGNSGMKVRYLIILLKWKEKFNT